jgi:hypothetical protein
MSPSLLIVATGIYAVGLAATIYFTRATPRRVVGALAGGAAVAVVGVGIELLAHQVGLWRYPGVATPYGPPLMYPLVVLIWTALALIGWRVTRRFGWRGQAVYLLALAVVGTLRDYLVAQRAMGLIEIAPGVVPMLVDAALWAGLTGLAQAVMRPIAGPAAGDPLARGPGPRGGGRRHA